MEESSEGGFDTSERTCTRLGFAAGSRIHTPMGLEAVVLGARSGRLFVRYEESNHYGVGYQATAPLPFHTPAELSHFGYRLAQPAERILRAANQRRSLALFEALGSKFLPQITPDLPSPRASECLFPALDDVLCDCRCRCRCMCVCQFQCRHPRHRHHNSLNIPTALAASLPAHRAGVHLDTLVDPYPHPNLNHNHNHNHNQTQNPAFSLAPCPVRPVLQPLHSRPADNEPPALHAKANSYPYPYPYPERSSYPPRNTKLRPLPPPSYCPSLSPSPAGVS